MVVEIPLFTRFYTSKRWLFDRLMSEPSTVVKLVFHTHNGLGSAGAFFEASAVWTLWAFRVKIVGSSSQPTRVRCWFGREEQHTLGYHLLNHEFWFNKSLMLQDLQVTMVKITLPETNSKFAPENMPNLSKGNLIFQPSIFRCEPAVSFREGNLVRST